MVKMKALVLLAAIFLATSASATGGRLNSKGCHNSKKVGYHCHRSQDKPAPVKKEKVIPKKNKQ